MVDILQADWWPDIVGRLVREPAQSLAEERGLSLAELDDALRRASTGGAAQEEPWWPEVLRNLHSVALRELARRFGTNPRRIRRALARSSVRIGGIDVGQEGLEALKTYQDRLGKEPDAAIADLAGVTVEAVQGERKRLGIPAFRMISNAEAWGEDLLATKEKPKERRRWSQSFEPEIIVRKATATGSTPSASAEGELPPEAEAVSEEAPVPPEPAPTAPEEEHAAPDVPAPARVRPAASTPRAAPPPHRGLNPSFTFDTRWWGRSDDQDDPQLYERVQKPATGTGRRRLVRPSPAPRPAPVELPPPGPKQRPVRRIARPVKVIVFDKPEKPQPAALERGGSPEEKTPPSLLSAIVAGSATGEPSSAPNLVTGAGERQLQAESAAPAVVSALQGPLRMPLAPVPGPRSDEVIDLAALPRSADEVIVHTVGLGNLGRPRTRRPRAIEPDEALALRGIDLRTDLFAWRVDLPEGSPVLVVAADIFRAVELVTDKLGREPLARASIRQVCPAWARWPL
jgi:hypothetical protein